MNAVIFYLFLLILTCQNGSALSTIKLQSSHTLFKHASIDDIMLCDQAPCIRDELKDVNVNFLHGVAISRANNSCVLASSSCIMYCKAKNDIVI